MEEEQLNYKFSKCSVGNFICMTDMAHSDEVSALTLNESSDSCVSTLKIDKNNRANNYATIAVLNESYTIPNVKAPLPAIIEVSCEHSLTSLNSGSVHFDNFNTELCFPSENKYVDELIKQSYAEHSRNVNETACNVEKDSFNSDDSLGIISDLVNNSDLSYDQLFLEDGISDFKPFQSAPLPTCVPSAVEANDYESPFVNEGSETESPVSSCFKSGKLDLSENECSPIGIPHMSVLASTPNHAFMKKLMDKINSEVPTNLICNISPDNVNANNRDKNCTEVLNVTYDFNFNGSDIEQEKVSIANELCGEESDPNPKCSFYNKTYDCIENVMTSEKQSGELGSPLRNVETNNCATQEIISSGAEKIICPFNRTQVMHTTFSTQSDHENTSQLSLKQHSAEFLKEVMPEYIPGLQKDDCSLDIKDFAFSKKSTLQENKKNPVKHDLNATISLPMHFSPKTITKPQNMIKNRKSKLVFSRCIPKPNKNPDSIKEKVLQNSSTVNKTLKPVNNLTSFVREKSGSFEDSKYISKMKNENSRINDLNATISSSNKFSSRSKNSIPNPQTVVKKNIRLPSSIHAKKTGAEYTNGMQKRFSVCSINMQKPSPINLNSTMLIEKAESDNIIKSFEKELIAPQQQSKIPNELNDKPLLEVCFSKITNESSFMKDETFDENKIKDSDKNSLLKNSGSAKKNSATVKKPMLPKHIPIVNKPATSKIKNPSSSILNALSDASDGKQKCALKNLCKSDGALKKNNFINSLPKPTVIKRCSDSQNRVKDHINYANSQKEGSNTRCMNVIQKASKENSDPNVASIFGLRNHKKMNTVLKTHTSLRKESNILQKRNLNVSTSTARNYKPAQSMAAFQNCVPKLTQAHKSLRGKSDILPKQNLNVTSIRIENHEPAQSMAAFQTRVPKFTQGRRSFLPVARKTSVAKAEINVPSAAKSSESNQSALKRRESSGQKLPSFQYNRHL